MLVVVFVLECLTDKPQRIIGLERRISRAEKTLKVMITNLIGTIS
jgi:hypothetical protein